MIGRLSQRKAIQRLSGVGTTAAAVAFAFALTGAGQLVGASLYADGSSTSIAFKLDTAGNAFPTNARPSGFAVSPNGEWLAVNLQGTGVTDNTAIRIFRRTGDKAFTFFGSLYSGVADELRFVSNTSLIKSSNSSGQPAYFTFNGTVWVATSYGAVLQSDFTQMHGGLGIGADGLFKCAMGRYASDTWNMGFCGVYNGVNLGAIGLGQTIDQYNNLKTLISPDNAKAVLVSSDYLGNGYLRTFNRNANSLGFASTMNVYPSGQPVFATWMTNTQLLLAITEYNIPPTNQQPFVGKMLRLQVADVSTYAMGTATPILNLTTLFSVPGNKVMDIIKLSGNLFGVVTDDFQFAVVSVVGMTVTLVGASALTFPKPYAAAFYRAS